jgi:SAM-dependent methyltransferase
MAGEPDDVDTMVEPVVPSRRRWLAEALALAGDTPSYSSRPTSRTPLPLADASADRVLCHDVLECLPDPDALVAEAARILRPGGRLVLAHTDYDTVVFTSESRSLGAAAW